MMKMKQIMTAAILAFFLLPACQSDQSGDKSQEKTEDNSKQGSSDGLAHEPLDAEDLLPDMKKGQRLELDSISEHHLERMYTSIRKNTRKMEDLRMSGYKKLKTDLEKEVKQIEAKSDLSGKPKEKRDQLLKHIKDQLKVLKGDDLQASQVALLNLSTIMEQFGKHFE